MCRAATSRTASRLQTGAVQGRAPPSPAPSPAVEERRLMGAVSQFDPRPARRPAPDRGPSGPLQGRRLRAALGQDDAGPGAGRLPRPPRAPRVVGGPHLRAGLPALAQPETRALGGVDAQAGSRAQHRPAGRRLADRQVGGRPGRSARRGAGLCGGGRGSVHVAGGVDGLAAPGPLRPPRRGAHHLDAARAQLVLPRLPARRRPARRRPGPTR